MKAYKIFKILQLFIFGDLIYSFIHTLLLKLTNMSTAQNQNRAIFGNVSREKVIFRKSSTKSVETKKRQFKFFKLKKNLA